MGEFAFPRIIISACNRSSGKTTVSIGLSWALSQRGFRIQTFKKGPDFIDPMWLTAASGRNCGNLDLFMMEPERIISSFQTENQGADLSLIEGNMGLYDGIGIGGEGSTSHLARLLKCPVVLVIDSSRMTRGIAPLILGYLGFEPDISISGIILNKVAGVRHEKKLKDAISHYCGIEVLGCLPNLLEIEIEQRYLGLIPTIEEGRFSDLIESIGSITEKSIDLNRIIAIAQSAPPLPIVQEEGKKAKEPLVRLGIANDLAFSFYYPENLSSLKRQGAELISFDTLNDSSLPEVDGLYIGGGFPEVFMDRLERNDSLRRDIRRVIEDGMPVYAECGGLMYLCRSIFWNQRRCEMVSAIPADIRMLDKPNGHGYVLLKAKERKGWFHTNKIKGHEFHYSEVVNLGRVDFAYEVVKGHGINGRNDGLLYKNLLAFYTHLHSLATPEWAEDFVSFINEAK